MRKRSTANPALPTAAANIPCAMKPKRNTSKIEDRARQKRMAATLAPLKIALLERSGRAHEATHH
jgi:hypothetical protein